MRKPRAYGPGLLFYPCRNEDQARALTIFCFCVPRPSQPSSTTSPTLRNFGGFMPSATPDGVPVTMMSPGSMMKYCEHHQTISATPKIMVLVLPFWRYSPLTLSQILRFCGSLSSSLVTTQGPIGPNVSQPLPLVHWPA